MDLKAYKLSQAAWIVYMRQVPDYGDNRGKGFCVHCGGANETRDHVPSKVFLDSPFPENLPISSACAACNGSFSLDEEYLACLLECVLAGDVEPAKITRPRIAQTITSKPALAARLKASRRSDGGGWTWHPEQSRVRNVLLKLARGHIAFETNEPHLEEPDTVWFGPLATMPPERREAFEEQPARLAAWPEVGTRALNRLLVLDDQVFEEGWFLVQAQRYRYRVIQDWGLTVRIVIREYLACEIHWL